MSFCDNLLRIYSDDLFRNSLVVFGEIYSPFDMCLVKTFHIGCQGSSLIFFPSETGIGLSSSKEKIL